MVAPNQYYVDPAINANSGTGTIGDPFGDLQYCLDTITRSTTVGDQINIKAGTAEFPTGSLSLATYGAPTSLKLSGYTSAANDGGQGVIDFGGSNTNVWAATYNNVILCNLKIRNNGTGTCNMSQALIDSCELEIGGQITFGGNAGGIQFSKVTTAGLRGIVFGFGGAYAIGNLLIHSGAGDGLYQNGTGCVFAGNVVRQSNAAASGAFMLLSGQSNSMFVNNSFINTNSSTGSGIQIQCTVPSGSVIANNLIQGYSGTGGTAIKQHASHTRAIGRIQNNRWFNCASGVTTTDAAIISENSALAASPFTDVSADDYRVSADVAGIGFPSALLGAALSVNSLDLGALQRVAGGSGGFSMSQLVNMGG
jgi:hypothetical protein